MSDWSQPEDAANATASYDFRRSVAGAPDGGCTGCFLIVSKYVGFLIFTVGVLFRLQNLFIAGGIALLLLDILFLWLAISMREGLIQSGAWMQVVAWTVGAFLANPWWHGPLWGSGFVCAMTAIPGLRILRR